MWPPSAGPEEEFRLSQSPSKMMFHMLYNRPKKQVHACGVGHSRGTLHSPHREACNNMSAAAGLAPAARSMRRASRWPR